MANTKQALTSKEDRRKIDRPIAVLGLAIIASLIMLAFISAEERYIALPAMACCAGVLWLWSVLWARDGKIPFFDVGMFCALVTLIYSVYPLLNYWVDGLQFGILSDNRLQNLDLKPAELGLFHLRHVLYLFCFIFSYSFFRRRGPLETGNAGIPDSSLGWIIVVGYTILTGYFILLQVTTGVNFNVSYADNVFERNVEALSNLPLLLLQISVKLWGILFLFKLAMLYIVVSRLRKKRWLIILLLWISAEIIQVLIIKGARTGLVMFLIATALMYHRLIKPLSVKFLLAFGAALLMFFIFAGIYRTYLDLSGLQAGLSASEGGIFAGGNEFQALLGTELDMLQRKEAGYDFPWYLYFNDFSTVLPPQQLLPFEKFVAASEWYLQEIGMSGTGVGFMWGVVSQSIIGFDWFELAVRGGILGYVLAWIHRWYVGSRYGFFETLFYIYICLKVYYTFRDTTFSIVANLVWEIIPFYIIVKLGIAIRLFFAKSVARPSLKSQGPVV